MASASTPSANEPAKDLIHTVKLKPMIKAYFAGRMVSIGISDAVFVSVYPEKTCQKKIIIIIIMNKSQETTGFSGCPKLTSAMKLRQEK